MTHIEKTKLQFLLKSISRNYLLYLLLLPGLAFLVLFRFMPLLCMVIAFQDYSPYMGILESPWVGLKHFSEFINDRYFYTLLKNTFLISFYTLVFSFPIPIIFSLFLNEVKQTKTKRLVQSLSFFPFFISTAVTVSIAFSLLSPQGGIVNKIVNIFGFESILFMSDPDWFRPLYVLLNIWNKTGYVAIVYLATITSIDPQLYEAAEIDGANRWKKMFSITLPLLRNIIIMMFIINLGSIVSIDLNKILVMYNPSVYDTADVIESYVYRQAFQSMGFPRYSFGAAMGIFQSFIGFVTVVIANSITKKYFDTRLF